MWWCLSCREPPTWAEAHDRQGFLSDKLERRRELTNRYGISAQEFQELMQLPGSMVNAFPFVPYERAEHDELVVKPPWRLTHGAAPALAAVAWRPVVSTARSADCRHLTNAKIRRLYQAAQKRDFFSHTDRYRRENHYRLQCQNADPPTPELLQYATGVWSREDGQD